MEKQHYHIGLILKYLAGDIHPAEKQALEAWLAEHEDHGKLFQDLQANWRSTAPDVKQAETAYQQIALRLNLQDEPAAPDKLETTQKTRKINTYWWRVAASFTGLLMIAAITYYLFFREETTRYQTGFGETATFILPDSSVVTLNAHSSLEYTTDWQQQTLREVWLKGEAFFHVRKINQPSASKLLAQFVVHTSQVDVVVLGTQFNVNERRGKTTVILNSGKVQLNSNLNQDEALVMEPGDYVELSTAHQQFVRKMVDPEIFSSWTEKKLMMDHTTLREIARNIEDYYGLKVVFEDQGLAEKALTGSIPTDDLDTFLKVLSASIDVQLQREENTLILRNKEAP